MFSGDFDIRTVHVAQKLAELCNVIRRTWKNTVLRKSLSKFQDLLTCLDTFPHYKSRRT